MPQNLIPIGILIIFIGFIVLFVGLLSSNAKSDTKFAVGGFIGFIPFGFANSKPLMYVLIGLMFVIALLLLILPYLRN